MDTGVNATVKAGSLGLTAQAVAKDAHDGSASARDVPAPVSHPCGCKTDASTITDPAGHAAWHALVLEQTGLDRIDSIYALKAVRGIGGDTLEGETIIDVKARESGRRASGKLREACR